MVSARRQALNVLAGSLLVPAWAQHVPQSEDKAAAPAEVGNLLPLPGLTLMDRNRFRPRELLPPEYAARLSFLHESQSPKTTLTERGGAIISR